MIQECITNRMIKRLEELKKEKETLAMEVEREEEMMSNTLQRKLTQVTLHCLTNIARTAISTAAVSQCCTCRPYHIYIKIGNAE
jgi:Uncharacterized conserved protein H4 (DUF2046)